MARGDAMNKLYFGDNLHVLRQHVKDESVDLVYLDPPFKSQASYNVLFKGPVGRKATAQITAFDDTWHWGSSAEHAFEEVTHSGSPIGGLLRSLRHFLGDNDMMAYLAMMSVRLIELRKKLKPTGSLYLHCDPTASHYLKLLLDGIFGADHFRNEIVWKRSHAHSDGRQGAQHFGRVTDTILFYSNSPSVTWNPLYRPYDPEYVARDYRRVDADGRRYRLDNIQGPGGAEKGNPYYEVLGVSRYWRYTREKMNELVKAGRIIQTRPGAVPQYKRYLDEMPGVPMQNLWDDMPGLNNRAKEFLGYPTQKPVALLERIIRASSNEGDVVLDPFCGCGTTIHAAEKLGRRWIGIDITHLAIQIIEDRLKKHFGAASFQVLGRPEDPAAARELASRDKYQFQFWAVSRVHGQPRDGDKKGRDGGVDGVIYFKAGAKQDGMAIVSVKGGLHRGPAMIRELHGTIRQEGADAGVFICLDPPSRDMSRAAAAAGFVNFGGHQYPRIQIVTIDDLFSGRRTVDLPPSYTTSTVLDAVRKAAPKPPRLIKPEDMRRQPSLKLPLVGGKGSDRSGQYALDVGADAIAPAKRRKARR
jgi:DNA modification methylase